MFSTTTLERIRPLLDYVGTPPVIAERPIEQVADALINGGVYRLVSSTGELLGYGLSASAYQSMEKAMDCSSRFVRYVHKIENIRHEKIFSKLASASAWAFGGLFVTVIAASFSAYIHSNLLDEEERLPAALAPFSVLATSACLLFTIHKISQIMVVSYALSNAKI